MATLMIDDDMMTSDATTHTARAWPVPGELTLWSVTWLPGRALTRDQAITAMTIAEVVAENPELWDDPDHRMWLFVDGWAAEVGLLGTRAVELASAPYVAWRTEVRVIPAGWVSGSG